MCCFWWLCRGCGVCLRLLFHAWDVVGTNCLTRCIAGDQQADGRQRACAVPRFQAHVAAAREPGRQQQDRWAWWQGRGCTSCWSVGLSAALQLPCKKPLFNLPPKHCSHHPHGVAHRLLLCRDRQHAAFLPASKADQEPVSQNHCAKQRGEPRGVVSGRWMARQQKQEGGLNQTSLPSALCCAGRW